MAKTIKIKGQDVAVSDDQFALVDAIDRLIEELRILGVKING